jgi:hypothetical protein
MYLMVRPALLLHILSNYLLIAVLPYRIGVVATRPEFASPELLLDLRMDAIYFPGSDALDDLYDHLRRHHRHALDEKMHVVFIHPNLDKMDLVSFSDTHAHIFKRCLHFFRKDLSSVLGRAYDVIEKKGFVMPFENMFAHVPILPLSRGLELCF